jgi:hypothetical protein
MLQRGCTSHSTERIVKHKMPLELMRTIITRRACSTGPAATAVIAATGDADLRNLAFDCGFQLTAGTSK